MVTAIFQCPRWIRSHGQVYPAVLMVALKGLILISCVCWRSNALFYFWYSTKRFFLFCVTYLFECYVSKTWFGFFSFLFFSLVYRNLNPISFGLRWLWRHVIVSLMSPTMPILRFWRSYWLFDSLIHFGSLRLFPLSTFRLRKKVWEDCPRSCSRCALLQWAQQ